MWKGSKCPTNSLEKRTWRSAGNTDYTKVAITRHLVHDPKAAVAECPLLSSTLRVRQEVLFPRQRTKPLLQIGGQDLDDLPKPKGPADDRGVLLRPVVIADRPGFTTDQDLHPAFQGGRPVPENH